MRNVISDIALHFPASGIRQMFDLGEQYPGYLNLCNGEPNFDTPRNIVDACIDSLNRGMTKYGTEPGLPALRQAVADKYTKQFGKEFIMANVMIAAGGVEASILSLMAVVNPGDEVIIPDPAYTCYEGQVMALGGKVVRVPLYEEKEFKLQPDDLEKVITPKTKAIVINYPSNPLGAILEKEDAEKLASVIKKHELIVISDEVYEKLAYDGRVHFSIGQVEEIENQVIVINSFSKTYAMTGWRLGYIVSRNTEIMSKMFKLQQTYVSCLPLFIQEAGVEALNGSQKAVEEMVKEYAVRRDLLINGLKEIKYMKPFETQGGFAVFINIKESGKTSFDFCKDILANAGVLIVPGTAFGAMGEGYIRICFANSQDIIRQGLEKMKAYLGGK